jgi:hypothetical protein
MESRTAHILTCNRRSERAIFSKEILQKIGFSVNFIDCINEGKNKEEKILSNRLSMTHIFELVKNSENNYSYIFEDDLNLVEEIKLPEIIQYESISSMFFYLGACSINYSSVKDTGIKINNHCVYSVNGNFCCLHAIGLSKDGAKKLLKFSENKYIAMDLILSDFQRKYPANIVRFDLTSPLNKDHRGIIYQDRSKFPTTIDI